MISFSRINHIVKPVQLSTIQPPTPKDSILPGFEAIFRAFENVGYIEELRQRWYKIKKLLAGDAPEAIPAAMRAKYPVS